MMKSPNFTPLFGRLLLVGFVLCGFAETTHARIGDSRSGLERRITSSGGIVYRDEAIRAARQRGMPYMRYLGYLSSSVDVRIYYKTDDGRRPKQSELEEKSILPGWDLHVVYVGGKSVLEIYKRSSGITDYEFNELLNRLGEGSYWKKVEKRKDSEEEDEEPSAFGFDMVRSDGKVRAKKIGADAVMFVATEFDAKLAEVHDSDLLEKAPVSVKGF